MSITVSAIQKLAKFPFDSSSFARNGRYDGTSSGQQSVYLDSTRFQEETFGPVVGIQKVASDEEAIKLMNDSAYGLTASVWTNAEKNPHSEEAFLRIAEELDTGTVFLNRWTSSTVMFTIYWDIIDVIISTPH